MLIAFEGIDGSGKTTSSLALRDALVERGARVTVVQWTSFQVYDDETEAQLFRVANEARQAGTLGPLAYSAWHCADFAYRLETRALPALERGEVVIMDRYKYTAYVRDVIRGLEEPVVRAFYSFAPEPDVLLYLDLDPAKAYARKMAAGARIGFYERAKDLFGDLDEKAGFIAFQDLCRKRYEEVLPKESLFRIDGDRPRDSVRADILGAIDARLKTESR